MASPNGFDLAQCRARAKDLLKLARAAEPAALNRIAQSHPEHETLLASGHIQLADAQLVIARENGYASWPRLKRDLTYLDCVRALDRGDIEKLGSLLARFPKLISERRRIGEWYDQGYFAGAMPLHHVAGNPIRCPIPPNIVEVTRFLLNRGADPNAATDGGETTISLLLTSKQASEAGVAVALASLLRSAGARDEISDSRALDSSLLNAAPETAGELVERGARIELRHAAGLGRLEDLARLLEQESEPLKVEEALAYACIRGQAEAARTLVEHGARGDVLVSPGGRTPRTALHEAANRGHMSIVRLLVENGADTEVLEPHWNGTPAGWARHGEPPHHDIAEYLSQHRSGTRAE